MYDKAIKVKDIKKSGWYWLRGETTWRLVPLTLDPHGDVKVSMSRVSAQAEVDPEQMVVGPVHPPRDEDVLASPQEGDTSKFKVLWSDNSLRITSLPVYIWQPKPDITAFEMAQCVPMLVAGSTGQYTALTKLYEGFGDDCKRHWKVTTYSGDPQGGCKLPSHDENPTGLHNRYEIRKRNGEPVDPNAIYFVLRLDNDATDKVHMRACRAAAFMYCQYIASHGEAAHLADVAEQLENLIDRFMIGEAS